MADPVTTPSPAAAQPAQPGATPPDPVQPAAAAPPEPKPTPRKFAAKVNGRDVELDETEVLEAGVTAAQIRRAAQERWDASQKAMAEVKAFREAFERDPVGLMRSLEGQNQAFRPAVEKWLTEQFQLEGADPATRARIDAERRAADAERRAQELENAQLRARQEAIQQQYRQDLDAAFTDALDKVGLPKTTEAIRRMAQLGQRYNQMGAEIDALRLARIVKQDMAAEHIAVFRELKGEALLRLIPPEVLKEIRLADVARVKAGQVQPASPPAPAKPTPAPARRGESVNPHLVSREEWYRRQGIDPDRDL